MARKQRKLRAARLPSGKYSWRGRAVSFGKLPKKEKHRFRSLWSRKAAKTVKRTRILKEKQEQLKREGIVVVFTPAKRTKKGHKIPATFRADRLPGQNLRDVIDAVRLDVEEKVGSKVRGSWIFEIEWPDDDRGKGEGEPFRSAASLGIQELYENTNGDPGDYGEEIEEAGDRLLHGEVGGSGGKGKSDVVTVEFAVFYGM